MQVGRAGAGRGSISLLGMSPTQDPEERPEQDGAGDPVSLDEPDGASDALMPWYRRWWVRVALLVLIVLVGVGIMSLMGGSPPPDPEPNATTAASDKPEPTGDGAEPTGEGVEPTQEALENEIHALGDVVTVSDVWEVTLQDPTMDATGQVLEAAADNTEPADGSMYATVYVSATNTSDQARTLYEEVGVTFIGSDGTQFPSADVLGPEDAYLIPTVSPGQTVSGSYVFEVPEGTSGGYWLIGPPADSSGSHWKAFANEGTGPPS